LGELPANAIQGDVEMWRAIVALFGVALAGSPAFAQPVDGRLKTVLDTATLRIAYRTDSRPFSYLDAQGRPTGYTIDLCQHVAKSLEKELRVPLAIKWVPVDTRNRFQAIIDGTADMECGSTTVSLSRMKLVDFSTVVFADSTGVLVKSDMGINSFDGMAGRKIGIIAGSTNARAIRGQLERRKLAATLVEFVDREEALASLRRGAVDGFATDKLVLLALTQTADAREFTLLPDDLSFEPFAIMVAARGLGVPPRRQYRPR
jgi:glutamate/aspartate transport system substrate-binding protein